MYWFMIKWSWKKNQREIISVERLPDKVLEESSTEPGKCSDFRYIGLHVCIVAAENVLKAIEAATNNHPTWTNPSRAVKAKSEVKAESPVPAQPQDPCKHGFAVCSECAAWALKGATNTAVPMSTKHACPTYQRWPCSTCGKQGP